MWIFIRWFNEFVFLFLSDNKIFLRLYKLHKPCLKNLYAVLRKSSVSKG